MSNEPMAGVRAAILMPVNNLLRRYLTFLKRIEYPVLIVDSAESLVSTVSGGGHDVAVIDAEFLKGKSADLVKEIRDADAADDRHTGIVLLVNHETIDADDVINAAAEGCDMFLPLPAGNIAFASAIEQAAQAAAREGAVASREASQ